MPWLVLPKANHPGPRQENQVLNFARRQFGLKKIVPFVEDPHGKFKPNYKGPYVLTKVLSSVALYLSNVEGDVTHELVNLDYVKLHYVECFLSLIV